MEKKYPVLKCNEELWNEIKPVLESFGITNFKWINNFEEYPFLISNYGFCNNDELAIGNIDDDKIDISYSLRYLVNTKEEFLSAVAKLLGKEYPIKEENKNTTVVATIPTKGNDFYKDKKDMEKINIANKLKYCKKGTKLYSPLFGEVEFDEVTDDTIYVMSIDDDNNYSNASFNRYGQFYSVFKNAECILFPSKDNRDWNNFRFLEEGHRVMCSHLGDFWELRDYIKNNETDYDPDNNRMSNKWKYIVPIEDFDFLAEDITVNKEKSIV